MSALYSYFFLFHMFNFELGERISKAFSEVFDEIDRLDWYKLPIELQKILPIILLDAQQLVVLECFGSISCSREVFKKVSENLDDFAA